MNGFAHALDEGLFYVGSVCEDCLMATENGDVSGNSEDWNEAQYVETLTKYDVTLGHPHFNKWHDSCPHNGHACPDDCDCEREEFSTSECGVCGSQLHGSRHDVVMIEMSLVR